VPDIVYKDIPVTVKVPIANNITVIKKVKKIIYKKELRVITNIRYEDVDVEKIIYVPSIITNDKLVHITVEKPVNCSKTKEMEVKIEVPELYPNPIEHKVKLWEEIVTPNITTKIVNKEYYVEVLNVTTADPEPIYKRVPFIEQIVEWKPTVTDVYLPFYSTKIIDKPNEGDRTKTTVEYDCS
jgi:hypothetical protein